MSEVSNGEEIKFIHDTVTWIRRSVEQGILLMEAIPWTGLPISVCCRAPLLCGWPWELTSRLLNDPLRCRY